MNGASVGPLGTTPLRELRASRAGRETSTQTLLQLSLTPPRLRSFRTLPFLLPTGSPVEPERRTPGQPARPSQGGLGPADRSPDQLGCSSGRVERERPEAERLTSAPSLPSGPGGPGGPAAPLGPGLCTRKTLVTCVSPEAGASGENEALKTILERP